MGLSKSQAQIWQKARSLGNGGQAVRLNDGTCLYLVARIVYDLDLQNHFPELRQAPRDFFSRSSSTELTLAGSDAKMLFERLVEVSKDADTYFACLSQLHKARLKYEKILSTQPIPTLEQVGPPQSIAVWQVANGFACRPLVLAKMVLRYRQSGRSGNGVFV